MANRGFHTYVYLLSASRLGRPCDTSTMVLLSTIIEVFRYSLHPIAPFTWFGIPITTLDLVATVRLCLVLRQIRDQLFLQHVRTNGLKNIEASSFVKRVSTTLLVVYGGEAMTGV